MPPDATNLLPYFFSTKSLDRLAAIACLDMWLCLTHMPDLHPRSYKCSSPVPRCDAMRPAAMRMMAVEKHIKVHDEAPSKFLSM